MRSTASSGGSDNAVWGPCTWPKAMSDSSLITPQFMSNEEFVERFRREARAAGRLRHPNVVDVTDFGFSDTKDGQVAYLVMEYLDGCTLGEILDEEKNLPVGWTLDILEQVCSAVHEAHTQGIIH